MIEGKPFKQQAYQTKMVVQKWRPPNRKWLVSYVTHCTIVGIERIIIRKLTKEGLGTVWTFDAPYCTENLVGHLFDLSLNNTIIDYSIGHCIYEDDLHWSKYADVITVVDAKNGRTNITPELLDAISRRYGA